MSEVRVKDALTGGEKGSKPERFDLIPVEAMKEVARVYGYGAEKYALRNWELGYDWGLSIAAMERHIAQFKNRESFDVESGRHHLAHAAFHCLALMTWEANGKGTDSRTRLNADVLPRIEFKGEPLVFDQQSPPATEPALVPYTLPADETLTLKAMHDAYDRCVREQILDAKAEREAQYIKDHEYVEPTA